MQTREKLEKERAGLTLHFTILVKVPKRDEAPMIEEIDGYVTTGLYADGRLGEFFICAAKKGAAEMGPIVSAMGPALEAWAKACSVALQYGAPVVALLSKEVATQYPPAGNVTGVAGVRWCSSITDLISRWLISRYAPKEEDRKNAFAGRSTMPTAEAEGAA